MEDSCPICQSITLKRDPKSQVGQREYSCATCQEFVINNSARQELRTKHYIATNPKNQALLSHATFRMSLRGEPAFLDCDLIEQILKGSLPSPAEQANSFVLWLDRVKERLVPSE